MGAINFSIDEELLELLCRELPLGIFFETGTFEGESLEIARKYFSECHSVELSPEYHAVAAARFAGQTGVHLYQGESSECLRSQRALLTSVPTLFWLDAHWCVAENSAGGNSQSPLLEELKAIGRLHPQSVILIDDARLYLCPPPAPHRFMDWPDFHSLMNALAALGPRHRVMILNDVIVVHPQTIHETLSSFAHQHGVDWLIAADRARQFALEHHLKTPRKRRTHSPRRDLIKSTGTAMLDIGVVLPTLNCAQLLPAHLESMQPWLDLVSEIVVVDSHSTDGTVELIRDRLRHPGLRVHLHPRGLYQSWNFGLSQLRTKYAYISTVGDSITRAGLEHLHTAAEKLDCDVVVSKPRFIANDGAPLAHEIRWPIDDVLNSLRISGPTLLEGLKLFYFTFLHLPAAVLGSSASNLYRTEVLQRRPFPTDYGTVGDGAWGALNVFDYRLGVTPEVFSTFRHHPKAYAAGEYAVSDIGGKLIELASDTFYKRLAVDAGLRHEAAKGGIDEMPRVLREQRKWHNQLELERERKLPWILNHRAWRARRRRNRFDELLQERKGGVMNTFNHPPEPFALCLPEAASGAQRPENQPFNRPNAPAV